MRGADTVNRRDDLGGGTQRIGSLVHRCGPGVALSTDEPHLKPANADDSLNHANLDARTFELGPLFDVQFEVRLQLSVH
jgi:hypothetical protein